jgi:hypothetical protein
MALHTSTVDWMLRHFAVSQWPVSNPAFTLYLHLQWITVKHDSYCPARWPLGQPKRAAQYAERATLYRERESRG